MSSCGCPLLCQFFPSSLSLAAWQGLVASQETGYTQADVFSLQREGKCKTGTWDLALELEAWCWELLWAEFCGQAVWLSSVLAAVPFFSWVLHQVFPTRSRKGPKAAARLWNKAVESRDFCRAVSPLSTIKSPKSPQSRTLVQEEGLLQQNDHSWTFVLENKHNNPRDFTPSKCTAVCIQRAFPQCSPKLLQQTPSCTCSSGTSRQCQVRGYVPSTWLCTLTVIRHDHCVHTQRARITQGNHWSLYKLK